MEQLTRAQLLVVVTEQSALLKVQGEQILTLTAQVAELTAKAGRNSQNSSMPPSSDRFAKPARPVRGRSGRKPGKQPGAPGSGLEFTASPDEIIDHVPGACAGCGSDLADAEPVGMSARQVRDVPLVKVKVTEHRMHRMACPCGQVSVAAAPLGVDGPVVYGPNLRAVAVSARPGRTGCPADQRPDRSHGLDRLGQRAGRADRRRTGRGREADPDAGDRRNGDRGG